MKVGTHIAAGACSGVGTALLLKSPMLGTLLLLLGGMVGALLPDIDHPQSWLGRRMRLISIPISMIFGHRGITHSLIALAGVFYLSVMCLSAESRYFGMWMPLALGLCVGYASHIVGDWLTPSGVPLLWPIKHRFRAPVTFFNGKFIEKIMMTGLWFGAGFLMAKSTGSF
ncbi:metal-dependent hydrolase [Craterilacuibacter sp.]|uniref:metal-dependent hydrolase n=1 Tax=Craterilacuibacter sp. TaxID=2870909 RepID=UPI003F332A4B